LGNGRSKAGKRTSPKLNTKEVGGKSEKKEKLPVRNGAGGRGETPQRGDTGGPSLVVVDSGS